MSFLRESPDWIQDKKHGIEIDWTDSDAYTFIYRPKEKLLFRAKTSGSSKVYHGTMVAMFQDIGEILSENPDIKTTEDFSDYCFNAGLHIEWDDRAELIIYDNRTYQVYGDYRKMMEFFIRMYKSNINLSSEHVDYRSMVYRIGVMGRYWEDVEISAFWLSKEGLKRLIKSGHMDTYFYYMGLNKANARLNTADVSDEVFTIDDFDEKQTKPTMSKEKLMALMRQQHTDPKAKKELHKYSDFVDLYKGELPAKVHHYARQSDGVIKLGDILKEMLG